MEVAIKRVILQVMEDDVSQARLKTALREATINSTLDHPNIVSTFTYKMQPMTATAQVCPYLVLLLYSAAGVLGHRWLIFDSRWVSLRAAGRSKNLDLH